MAAKLVTHSVCIFLIISDNIRRSHAFFFSCILLLYSSATPPYVPDVEDDADTSHFDEIEDGLDSFAVRTYLSTLLHESQFLRQGDAEAVIVIGLNSLFYSACPLFVFLEVTLHCS